MRRALVLGAALLCTACLPHVMHGPRIEDDGFSTGLSLTLGTNSRFYEDDRLHILPSLYMAGRQSFVPGPDRDGPALAIGLQVPLLVAPLAFEEGALDVLAATSYVDVYLQPLRRAQPGWELGIGALASTEIAAPYVQIGRMKSNGAGWYTTQLVAFVPRDTDDGFIYLPTVVRRVPDSVGRTAGNFSFGLGVASRQRDVLVLLGASFELGLQR